MIGRTLSHYKVLAEIDRGGMGVVYRALDVKLNREVAFKTLPESIVGNEDRKWRFLREARAAAALKHPNIGVVYEVDEVDGVSFIAMELIEGESLSQVIARERLSILRILDIAVGITGALARAHEKGIIHRDLKPANVMLTEDGHPKVIDFGLAKLLDPGADAPSAVETAVGGKTHSGAVMGTVSYMSPEQALGKSVDARSDLFSFGAMLYELETGRSPFEGDTTAAVFDAILHKDPSPPRQWNPAIPADLEKITMKLLEKNPDERFQSARELADALEGIQASGRAARRGSKWSVPAVVAVVLLLAIVGSYWRHASRVRWAREVAIPEIARLADGEEHSTAFALALEAEKYAPDDPALLELWPRISRNVTVETTPEGAEVSLKEYGAKEGVWTRLGATPLEGVRIPRSFLQWKLEKPGYQTVQAAAFGVFDARDVSLHRTLDEHGSLPPGMVRVESANYYPGFVGLDHLQSVSLEAFLIDRYEVTNRQFKEFVDSGGYRKKEYWKQEFIRRGEPLSWDEAMARFADQTGRPSPAGWELGTYPEGQADHPVTGVSWYEAAAYAEYAGKELPTLYHWGRAAGNWLSEYLVPVSNFDGEGATRGGDYRGVSHVGVYDMAGNAKEWCWNETGKGRFLLGGAWNEPAYSMNEPDAQDPFERGPTFGFRCVKLLSDGGVPEAAAKRVEPFSRDFTATAPVSDEVFAIYRRLFAYDRADLHPKLEWKDDSAGHWLLEKISIDAAYGGERLPLYLFLPKNVTPPYQTVLYFPGSNVISDRSSEIVRTVPSGGRALIGGVEGLDFMLKSGRALVLPVYKGTYERGGELPSDRPSTTASYQDHLVMWGKDLGRTIDYLETRPDLSDKLAFYGFSWGAYLGAILPAVETRFQASILVSGGFYLSETLPEADPVHYAPRVKVPTLMLNGRHDFTFPLETTQRPMFELLGTPTEHKRHVLFESYHTVPRNEGIKEILDWLDKYLGPVS